MEGSVLPTVLCEEATLCTVHAMRTPRTRTLKLDFKGTHSAVSRDTLKRLAKKRELNEIRTILYALARLRDEVEFKRRRVWAAERTRAFNALCATP
jgi:hypothetical protein